MHDEQVELEPVLLWSDSESFKVDVLQEAGLHKCLTLRVFGNVMFTCLIVAFLHVEVAFQHSLGIWRIWTFHPAISY